LCWPTEHQLPACTSTDSFLLVRYHDEKIVSYDNALAESVIGLYKTELIRNRGPWRGLDQVEFATLEWVDWWNHRRLLEPIGMIPPAEKETNYYRQTTQAEPAVTHNNQPL
jgi:transposase InsO family protein